MVYSCHAKFFRFAGANGAAYERSATVGFRCAYNRAVSAISEQEVSNVAPGAIQLGSSAFWLFCCGYLPL